MKDKVEWQAKLNELEQWFKNNPKLPQKVDPLFLQRFLKCMYGEVEDTQKLIELNYALRNKHQHIFINRDPADENLQKTIEAADILPLPGLTPERYKILFYRLSDKDPSKMNSVEESKLFFMTADCRFTMADVELCDTASMTTADAADNMAEGDVQIVDIAGYTMGHIARISFLTLRIYMKFLQEAYPVRLRAMHVINCPSYLDKMIAIVKPFIDDEVYKMIHFHTGGLETLYDHVPRDMLPEEYGGKAGKIEEIKTYWRRTLLEKRTYLTDPSNWKLEPQASQSRWFWW